MSKNKIKIAVVAGGLSNEREVSLKTGKQIFSGLSADKYDKNLINIDQNGRWFLDMGEFKKIKHKTKNRSLVIMHPEKGIKSNDLKKYDLIFLALHGKFGEDGKIQSILDLLDIKYTGSGVLASALCMNKEKTMSFLRGSGIKTPKFLFFSDKDKIDLELIDQKINEKIKYPCVVKPNESGSSIGISIVKSFVELKKSVEMAFLEDSSILIEEFIGGREFSCGVLGNSNKTELLALPPVEIISDNDFFDYNAKYFSKNTQEICPANISLKDTEKIQNIAKKAHEILGCEGLTRSDFILKGKEFYFLEINTLPGLTEQSLCPKEAKATGMSFEEFLDEQIKLAIQK